MQRSLTQRLIRNSFGLSVLLHLLLLLAIILLYIFKPADIEPQKSPNLYVPSFIYTGGIKPTLQSQSVRSRPTPRQQPITSAANNTPPAENASQQEEAPKEHQATSRRSPLRLTSTPPVESVEQERPSKPQSILASSMATLKANQMESIRNNLADTEPVLLIGDPNTPADPLIKLMARSLSTYFRYPDTEGMMGIHGRVLVKLTLHPEGYYTDIQLIQSSDNENLDAAALFAANKAPRVVGADHFMQKPKRYLIGFVFY